MRSGSSVIESIRAWIPSEAVLKVPDEKDRLTLEGLLPDASVLLNWDEPVSSETLVAARKLKLIQHMGTIPLNVDLAAAERQGVPVAIIPATNWYSVAEHCWALLLACAKRLVEGHERVTSRVNPKGLEPMRTSATRFAYNWSEMKGVVTVRGKTIGIVGAGKIGLEFARIARGFGVNVMYTKRNRLPEWLEQALRLQYVYPDELWQRSDIICVHVAHSEETEGLVDKRAFDLMKHGVMIINTARGSVIDEPSLVAALRSGKVAYAGLDVFTYEPPLRDCALLDLPNVVLTPHYASGFDSSPSANAHINRWRTENIERLLRGDPPLHLVTEASLRRYWSS
jgi:lactate dehydrogenase-like 2-hydroxyacid dehydrogenase